MGRSEERGKGRGEGIRTGKLTTQSTTLHDMQGQSFLSMMVFGGSKNHG
jgi:hypothetical protein